MGGGDAIRGWNLGLNQECRSPVIQGSRNPKCKSKFRLALEWESRQIKLQINVPSWAASLRVITSREKSRGFSTKARRLNP